MIVPARARHDRKIFTLQRDAVLALLGSFGLDRQHAERVIEPIGTAP
jgi:hypothetical protein